MTNKSWVESIFLLEEDKEKNGNIVAINGELYLFPFGKGIINPHIYDSQNSFIKKSNVLVLEENAFPKISPLIKQIRGELTEIYQPRGLAADKRGNIYCVNSNNSITVYNGNFLDSNTRPINAIRGKNTKLDYPIGITLDNEDFLYVSCKTSNGGGRINVFKTPITEENVSPYKILEGDLTMLDYPTSLCLDKSDNLLVSDFSGKLLKFDKNWSCSNTPPISFLTKNEGILDQPRDLSIKGDEVFLISRSKNKIYSTDFYNDKKSTIKFLKLFPNEIISPVGIQIHEDYIFVTNFEKSSLQIYEFENSNTDLVLKFNERSTKFKLFGPRGLTISKNYLFIANFANNSISSYPLHFLQTFFNNDFKAQN